MKKFSLILSILLTITVEVNFAQLSKDSWSVGGGFRFPRFLSINTTALNSNYGGYIFGQRNFSEHVALRLKLGYSHLESSYTGALSTVTASTNAITGDLDFLYYLVPCEPVSPYLFGGVGGFYRMLNDKVTTSLDDNAFGFQFNGGVGLEWNLLEELKLVTEFGYHITNNSELEGAIGASEVNGRDSYMGVSLGVLYFIDKGEPSKYCQLYSGITSEYKDMTNYDKIEDMIKRHIPQEVTKEVVVEKASASPITSEGKWILVGVNFALNSAKLTAESYPILYDAAKTLLKNPDMKVEIDGYTDDIGAQTYNKKLSQQRADVVKNYLISKGIDAGRLTAVGCGESSPIGDNKTEAGRAMNRRIEFKIK